jgi:starch synthase
MNILFAASEMSPYAKTGGLGDVLAALPAALRKRGHSVSVVLPLYRGMAEKVPGIQATDLYIDLPLGREQLRARVWEGVADSGVRLYFIQRDEFYDRSHLYGTQTGDYADNAARFIYFNKAVVELARYIRPTPQILHLHDWQTGLVPAIVRSRQYKLKTVFTIHNLAFQGSFWAFDFDLSNLPGEYFSPPGVEFYGRLNLLKGALLLANQLTTVSPRYAEEIQTHAYGCSLEGVLKECRHKLTGILNGVDYNVWDPHTDPHLPSHYTASSPKGKAQCKKALLEEFNLPLGNEPVFGIVSRLTTQKGFDLIQQTLEDSLLKTGAKFVLLGSGDPFFESFFTGLAAKYPRQVGVKIGFDEPLAHRIEAGSDFFLMPSQFEPCGLNQLYSLRYGTPPIVHETGGLSDSVDDYDENTGKGTGFKFGWYEAGGLRQAIQRALKVYAQPKALANLRHNGMQQEFSWDISAAAYEKVYANALKS